MDDLLSPGTAPNGGRSSATGPAGNCGPARPVGARPGCRRSPRGARRRPAAPGTGEPTVDRTGTTRGDTCHVDVVDRWGNIVSATPSGGWLQSSPVIPSLGFPLGTRAQMFWLEPGLPNSLVPRKRPAPRSRRPSPSAAASPPWPSARRAVTSRSSGSCASGWRTPSAGWTCRRPSTRRPGTPRPSRRPSTRGT